MRDLTKSIVNKIATEGTLIHREPEGDYDPNEPWWSESHWLVENGKITGVRIAAKCTQDTVPQEQLIRFKMRGSTFELVSAETVKNPAAALVTSTKPLPEPAPAVVPPTPYLSATASTPVEPIVDGESKLEIRVSKGTSSTYNYDNGRDDTLCQSLKSATITITNPTDKRIAIPEYWMEFLQEDGSTWMKSETRVGVNSTDYYGRSVTNFVDLQSFEVEAHASIDIVLEGTWAKPKGYPAYNGRPHNQRIHAAFPDPLIGRIVVKDDTNALKTLQFQHTNEPLDSLWTTYEEAVAQTTDSKDGFGASHRKEMWLCVENPLDLNKCIICVTTAEENPHAWFARVQTDRRDIGGSYNSAGPLHFRKLAFKSTLQQEVPTEVSLSLYLYEVVNEFTGWLCRWKWT
jgi:hypothetical protein